MRNPLSSNEHGAVLVHVGFMLAGLIAFSAFVTDYGILWVSRRQAQNAADASAHAGAVALAFDDFNDRTDTGPAKLSAINTGNLSYVWGAPASITAADVDVVTPCPDKSKSNGCVKADVFRDAAHSNPLPTFFGRMVGVSSQDTRATATAKVEYGTGTDCLKPWAVADKWAEHYPVDAPWTTSSIFDKYDKKHNLDPSIKPPDYYQAPTKLDPGTGFTPFGSGGAYTDDYGLELTLKLGNPNTDNRYSAGWFNALALTDSTGGKDYRNNIKHCVGVDYEIGQEIPFDTEPGNKVGPTVDGVQRDQDSLINQDPAAVWVDDPDGSGPQHGYVMGKAGLPNISPRIVAVPLFNPDEFAEFAKGGRSTLRISNIMGFFIERMDGNDIVGRLVAIPSLKKTGGTEVDPQAAFLRLVVLVR